LKALFTMSFSEDEFKSLGDLGYEIIFEDEKDFSLSEEMKDAEVLVCFNPFEKLQLADFPKLKWIQLLSAGVNHAPAEEILEKNILLTNNRGGYSIPIAEWIVLKALEMINNSKEFYEKQNERLWEMDNSLRELHGKTIGFIGTGDIAQEAAKRLDAFGVKILGISATGKPANHFHETYPIDKIKEIVAKCDFLVVAAPYTEQTHHLVDEEVLSSMKDGVYLINIARGSIIDEKVMIEYLRSGKIKKAALDVFEIEPLPVDNPLWEMDNVIVSPHNCWGSEMTHQRRFEIAHKNMKKYINNEELVNVIDLNKGY